MPVYQKSNLQKNIRIANNRIVFGPSEMDVWLQAKVELDIDTITRRLITIRQLSSSIVQLFFSLALVRKGFGARMLLLNHAKWRKPQRTLLQSRRFSI